MTYKGANDEDLSLWSETDGLYYDAISFGPGQSMQLPIHSLVGLMPLYATLTLEPSVIDRLPGFKKRMEWFIENRPEVSQRNMANMKGDRAEHEPSSWWQTLTYSLFFSSWQGREAAVGAGEQRAPGPHLRENVR